MTGYNIDKTLPPEKTEEGNILAQHHVNRTRGVGSSPVQQENFTTQSPKMVISENLKKHVQELSQKKKRIIISRIRTIEGVYEYKKGESAWYPYTQSGGIQEKETFRALEKEFRKNQQNTSHKQERLFLLSLMEYVKSLLPKAHTDTEKTMEQIFLQEQVDETKMLVDQLLASFQPPSVQDELTSILVALTEKKYNELPKLRKRVLDLIDAEHHARELGYSEEDDQ